MKEKDFHPIIVKSLISRGHWAYKIPDDMGGGAFALNRPFDLFASVHQKAVAIEVKLFKGYQAFKKRHFQEHQITSLSEFKGRSFVFLIIWKPRDTRLLIFDWQYLCPIINREGFSKGELEEFTFVNCFKKDFALENFCRSLETPIPRI